MNKKIALLLAALVCILGILCWNCFPIMSMAAERNDEQSGYITIAVDAEDDNGDLMYAIDSDDPEAFGTSNVFVIDPNIPHTIYVRDIAGNISSQSFQPIGLEVGDADAPQGVTQSDQADYNAAGTHAGDGETAEDGTGTMYDKVTTDGTDDFSRVFYTVTTKEGEVFYLVIDQNRGQDNVYLLNMVTVDELQALAADNGYVMSETKRTESTNSQIAPPETIDDLTGGTGSSPSPATDKKNSQGNMKSTVLILVAAVIGGGVYYYLKVYKKKKDAAMDEIDQAHDMDDFVSNNDDGNEIDMPADDTTISDDEFYSDMYGDEESNYLNMDPDDDDEEGE